MFCIAVIPLLSGITEYRALQYPFAVTSIVQGAGGLQEGIERTGVLPLLSVWEVFCIFCVEAPFRIMVTFAPQTGTGVRPVVTLT